MTLEILTASGVGEVEAEPCPLGDQVTGFAIHAGIEPNGWVVSDIRSGHAFGWGSTRPGAIAMAEAKLTLVSREYLSSIREQAYALLTLVKCGCVSETRLPEARAALARLGSKRVSGPVVAFRRSPDGEGRGMSLRPVVVCRVTPAPNIGESLAIDIEQLSSMSLEALRRLRMDLTFALRSVSECMRDQAGEAHYLITPSVLEPERRAAR